MKPFRQRSAPYCAVISLLLLGCVALAVSYRVEPDALQEAVATAFSAWRVLDPELAISEAETEAEAVFDYGEAAAFGPDTLSLTVQRGNAPLRILINESKTETLPRVLLHETGLVLGISSAAGGMMNPSVAEESAELGDLERQALDNAVNAVKEDINRDGVVDFYDLNEFARAFGQTNLNNLADINGDDVVDAADLELLRAAYTFSEPSATEPVSALDNPDLAGEDFPLEPAQTPVDGAPDEPVLDETLPGGIEDINPPDPTGDDTGIPPTDPSKPPTDSTPPPVDTPAAGDATPDETTDTPSPTPSGNGSGNGESNP